MRNHLLLQLLVHDGEILHGFPQHSNLGSLDCVDGKNKVLLSNRMHDESHPMQLHTTYASSAGIISSHGSNETYSDEKKGCPEGIGVCALPDLRSGKARVASNCATARRMHCKVVCQPYLGVWGVSGGTHPLVTTSRLI